MDPVAEAADPAGSAKIDNNRMIAGSASGMAVPPCVMRRWHFAEAMGVYPFVRATGMLAHSRRPPVFIYSTKVSGESDILRAGSLPGAWSNITIYRPTDDSISAYSRGRLIVSPKRGWIWSSLSMKSFQFLLSFISVTTEPRCSRRLG